MPFFHIPVQFFWKDYLLGTFEERKYGFSSSGSGVQVCCTPPVTPPPPLPPSLGKI